MPPMKTSYQYSDIINLEYFLHKDRNRDNELLHKRDREIFLQEWSETEQTPKIPGRELLMGWLHSRVKEEFSTEQRSPGDLFGDSHKLATLFILIFGLAGGCSAGWSFFAYTGSTPVNVFHFLLLFVFSQLASILFLFGGLGLRLRTSAPYLPGYYSNLFRLFRQKIIFHLIKNRKGNLSRENQDSFQHALGVAKAHSTLYGSLFYWPIFLLSQLFAVAANLGVITATLLKVSTTDLAFGWQSTLQFSSETLYGLVRLIAVPWSWFAGSGLGHPTLEEIAGSKIILKEGIYNLTTTDLVAWWPFLVLCLVFYGLFFRLCLLYAGYALEKNQINGLALNTPEISALLRRMQTPLVSTQAAQEKPRIQVIPQKDPSPEPEPQLPQKQPSQLVLVPDDIFLSCTETELNAYLDPFGLNTEKRIRFMTSYEEDQQLLQTLSAEQPKDGIVIIMEGWMVPLVDFLSFLKELRNKICKDSIIHLALIGKPVDSIFTQVTKRELTIWKQKVEAGGDPYINIFALLGTTS